MSLQVQSVSKSSVAQLSLEIFILTATILSRPQHPSLPTSLQGPLTSLLAPVLPTPPPRPVFVNLVCLCPPLQLHLSPMTSFGRSHPPRLSADFKCFKLCLMFGQLLSWSCHHQQPGELSMALEAFPVPHSGLGVPLRCPHSTLSLPIRVLIPGVKTLTLTACQNQQEPCSCPPPLLPRPHPSACCSGKALSTICPVHQPRATAT